MGALAKDMMPYLSSLAKLVISSDRLKLEKSLHPITLLITIQQIDVTLY